MGVIGSNLPSAVIQQHRPGDSAASPEHPLTPEAFISYARTDKALVRPLHDRLASLKRNIWIDWEDIHPSETFMEAIERAIEAASIFVFIVSPDSVQSKICRHELEHAETHGKKLVPIVCRDVAVDSMPPSLARLDWIFARNTDDITEVADRLCRALDTDLEWVRTHTRLLVRAVEWDLNGRNRSFLLQGVDLGRAERALAQVPAGRMPHPTTLQHEYLLASRRWSSQRLRIVAASVTVGLLVAIVLGWLADYQRREAEGATRRGLARQLAAQSELVRRPIGEPLTLSALLAAESLQRYPSLEGDLAMRRALTLLPRPPVHIGERLEAGLVELSPDGHLLAAVEEDGAIKVIDTHTGEAVATLVQPAAIALVWSPDAHHLLTADEQRSIRVWELARGQVIANLTLRESLGAVAFSGSGERVAVTDRNEMKDSAPSTVRMWDLRSNREVARFTSDLPVRALALDTTGKQATILAASFFSTRVEVRTEPFQNVIAEKKLNGHTGFARFSANGTLLAFVNRIVHIGGGVSGNQEVAVYAVEPAFQGNGVRLESTSLPHPCDVNGIEFSPEGSRIVTSCVDGTVRAWNPTEGRPVAQLAAPGPISSFAVGPQAATIALQGEDNFAHLFALPAATHTTSIHYPNLSRIAMSVDGRYLALVDHEGRAGVWEPTGGSALHHMVLPADVRSVHFPVNGSAVAVCTGEGAELFQLQPELKAVALSGSGNALACAFSPEGQFYTASAAGTRFDAGSSQVIGDDDIRAWDGSTGRLLSRRPRPAYSDMAVSENGRYIAIAESGGGIVIAELASGRVMRILKIPEQAPKSKASSESAGDAGPRRVVTSLGFSPNGDHLAVVYEERRAQVWDVATGAPGPIIDLPDHSFVSLLSPDGRFLATTSMGASSPHDQLWDAATGRAKRLRAPDEFFNTIVFSPDGRLVATVVDEHTAQVWDLDRPRLVSSMLHPELVYSVAFNAAGTHLATGSADQNARIWEIASGREMARMAYDYRVFGVVFDAAGRQLAVRGVGPDLWLELWRPEDLLDEASKRVTRNLTRDEWDRYLPDTLCRATFRSHPDGCGAAEGQGSSTAN